MDSFPSKKAFGSLQQILKGFPRAFAWKWIISFLGRNFEASKCIHSEKKTLELCK
jgi:hypothetical protein